MNDNATKVIWHDAQLDPPKLDRRPYLIFAKSYTLSGYYFLRIAKYANNLINVDEYDFADKNGKSGWFDYDSEYGFYEITNVRFWAELPEPPEGVEYA